MMAGSGSMKSETRMSAALRSPTTARQATSSCDDIETAFGGALLAPLGNETTGVRQVTQCNVEHLLGGGHFQIERARQLALQAGDVLIGDMAPVLAQVRGDAIGTSLDCEVGGAQRIGMTPSARVADGCNVIDVDTETEMRGHKRLRH